METKFSEKSNKYVKHEEKSHAAETQFVKLGVEIDGEGGRVAPKVSRRWRLHQGTLALLTREKVKPAEVGDLH